MRKFMAATISRMTKTELKEMIETAVEQKLLELLGDPDEGLSVKKAVRDRLIRQRQSIGAGQEGEAFADVVRRLKLD